VTCALSWVVQASAKANQMEAEAARLEKLLAAASPSLARIQPPHAHRGLPKTKSTPAIGAGGGAAAGAGSGAGASSGRAEDGNASDGAEGADDAAAEAALQALAKEVRHGGAFRIGARGGVTASSSTPILPPLVGR
jgi:hypothetical protein